MSISRRSLSSAELYTQTLEEVLGFPLEGEELRRRDVRKRYETIAKSVQTISMGLTRERDEFIDKQYLGDATLRQAYLLYYTTTNMLKVIPPLRELALSGFFERDEPLHILDLGSGTGAALWGLIQFLEEEIQKKIKIRILAVDSVSKNLITINDFHSRLRKRCQFVTSELRTQQDDLEKSEVLQSGEKYDLIMMMNTFNELSPAAEQTFLSSFNDLLTENGVLLMIEPASRSQSRRLLSFRDRVVESGATIFAPCTRQSNCPALIKDSDWCHSNYDWDRPEYIRLIDDFAETLRLSLKSTYLTIVKKSQKVLSEYLDASDPLLRVVSERFDEKGRTRAVLCSEKGRGEFVLNKRHKNIGNKVFTDIERYDLLSISHPEIREHDTVISEASEVKVVLQNVGAR